MNTDLSDIIADLTKQYGPIITAQQAAEIAHRKIQTIYDWSSQELLEDCRAPSRGPLLLTLPAFVRFLFSRERDRRVRKSPLHEPDEHHKSHSINPEGRASS